MPYEYELQIALEAAELAGSLILEHYGELRPIPDAPADISTDTDRQAQAIILRHIHQAFPNDALCAEETIADFAHVATSGQRLWIVDPIDGTRGFARKNGEFSVMVAFVAGGEIAAGVVAEPAHERITYARRGDGCWRRDQSGAAARCLVTGTRDLAAATVVQSHSKPGKPSPQLLALHPSRVLETYSAGIKLALVARGEADLYLNTYDASHDWDICAGQILVEEAGGKVTNFLGQTPVYGLPGSLQKHGLLASNGVLHEAALEALRA
jgi:3'(2'), 5'-bisphosphate nucleotidase